MFSHTVWKLLSIAVVRRTRGIGYLEETNMSEKCWFPHGNLNLELPNRVWCKWPKRVLHFNRLKCKVVRGIWVPTMSTVQKQHCSFRPLVISSHWPRGAPESWCLWRCPPKNSIVPSETLWDQGRSGALRGGWGPWAGREGALDWCWTGGRNLV